jgi:hypothetical protein
LPPADAAGLEDDDGAASFLRPELGDHGGVYWHLVPYMMQFMHDWSFFSSEHLSCSQSVRTHPHS